MWSGRTGEDLRSGGGDILPGFGDVLLQLIEGCDAQLPLNVRQLLLLDCQHLRQRLDFILYLDTETHTDTSGSEATLSMLVLVLSCVVPLRNQKKETQ